MDHSYSRVAYIETWCVSCRCRDHTENAHISPQPLVFLPVLDRFILQIEIAFPRPAPHPPHVLCYGMRCFFSHFYSSRGSKSRARLPTVTLCIVVHYTLSTIYSFYSIRVLCFLSIFSLSIQPTAPSPKNCQFFLDDRGGVIVVILVP